MGEVYRKTFNRNTWEWHARYGGYRPSFCHSGVARYYDIPRDVVQGDLVFSDVETEDSMCIKLTTVMYSWRRQERAQLKNYCTSGGSGVGLPSDAMYFFSRIIRRFAGDDKRLWITVEY